MAIPFHLPTDEETEDNYRRLDQLLLDLYHVLRQILLRPRYVPGVRPEANTEDRGRGGGGPAPNGSRQVAADVTGSRRPDLPDVVPASPPSCACACQCPSRRPQRRHRRRRRAGPGCCPPEPAEVILPPADPRPVENWLVIGEQLRRIADEFKSTFKHQEERLEEKNQALKAEVKTSGMFSLLVPAHFHSSIWTTVILLVGWRLLVRSR